MSQDTSNHVTGFVSHISVAERPSSSLVFFTSVIPSLRLILKGTLYTHTHTHLHFYVLSEFLHRFLGCSSSDRKVKKTSLVRTVIRDKSCWSSMTKSLGGKCSHVPMSVWDDNQYVAYDRENIHRSDISLVIVYRLRSILCPPTYMHHTQSCNIYTTPCKTKCTVFARTYKSRKDFSRKT